MTIAIAIETSSRIGSVAIVREGRIAAEEQFQHGLQHAATILPMLDRLCRNQGISPADIEQVYISAGPGSFTGLRIGITMAKMMALARGVRIVAVPTVRVLVENAPPEARHVIIVLDAKRDQIFTARFERVGATPALPGAIQTWIEREPAHVDSLQSMLTRSPRPVHLIGEGIPFHQKFLPANDPAVIMTSADLWRPRAATVAGLGMQMAAGGEFADPDRLTPIYLRKPEAEEKYEAAHPPK